MNRFRHTLALMVGALAVCSAAVAADAVVGNALEQVSVGTEGNMVVVKIDMASEPANKPGNWSIVEPPRIVLDFPDAENRTGKTAIPVSTADVKSMNIVQSDKLTRLVLNLYRANQYSVETSGKSVYVRIAKRATGDAADTASAAARPTSTMAATPRAGALDQPAATVRDVSFRRGDEAQAIIAIDLSDGSVPVDVRRDGNSLRVELRGAELPERLRVRRDVTDFATPVTSVTSLMVAGAARFDVASKGAWFHQSSMSGNQLILEVKPVPQSDSNRLVQAGQQGQKVSINFFDADAMMILRTLAEISGKNVMIDPSLAGRKLTVSLDNIAYDQALEIVMAQVNAGMRVKGDIVVFGDRAVLQKRDQDEADELAKANDTAPLVSETFTLNYIKPSEMASLIVANVAAPGGATDLTKSDVTPTGTQNAQKTGMGGMLSTRGKMSTHDLTKKLFIRDTAAVIDAIREMIRSVDVPQKQVLIEARIVSATTGTTGALGVRMNLFSTPLATVGGYKAGFGTNVTPTYGNVNVLGQTMVPSLVTSNPQISSGVTLPGAANIGLMLFNNNASRILALELSANEKDNKAKALSSPRVVTESGKEATISTTTTQTYLAGINNGTATYAQCVGPIALKVTPTITQSNEIKMTLDIQRGNARIVTIGAAQGCESTVDAIKTNLTIEDGGTVVIGGVIIEDESNAVDRLPFFGDLPYVGFLFKATSKQSSRKELLIFLTPRIVRGVGDGAGSA